VKILKTADAARITAPDAGNPALAVEPALAV